MNELAKATSPYLLQHKDNPVHWMEWSDAAFAKAKKLNKPVFLSIGYSTCHWCHVMAHESFEDEATAKILNEHFICIKVDREERPDIDSTYMTFVQATTGRGGWPLSVWLTPDATPITGGTYFAPEDRGGMAGFPRILVEIAKAWKTDSKDLIERGDKIMKSLQQHATSDNTPLTADLDKIQQTLSLHCLQAFDTHEAGFNEAPKFPRPAFLDALLAHPQKEVRNTAIKTLEAMIRGGIHDHLGGGFHRYSVDTYWHIPHYEKMLYDQGQLLISLSEAYLQTSSNSIKTTIYSLVNYLRTEMLDETGAFHAAEDADSLPTADSHHKKEGAYWVWTADEISKALPPKDAMLFSTAYGVKAEGNARPESDPHGELKNTNTLYLATDMDKLRTQFDLSTEDIQKSLAASREKLLELRKKRPLPHRDDKILTAWNALAICGLARAGFIFDQQDWIDSAEKALKFIKSELWDGKILYRSYRKKNSGIQAFPQDYAYTIAACLELDGVCEGGNWITWAKELQLKLDELFWSPELKSYVTTASLGETKLLTLAEDYDGAEPSPNNLSARNLLRLSERTQDLTYAKRAHDIISGNQALAENPTAMPLRVLALQEESQGLTHVSWSGALNSDLIRRLAKKLPTHALLTRTSVKDSASVTICHEKVCHPAAKTPEELNVLLAKLGL